jgi:hypothetical protein
MASSLGAETRGRRGSFTGVSGGSSFAVSMKIAEGAAWFRHPVHAARHWRAIPYNTALRGYPGGHDDEEKDMSLSTPGYRLG